MYISYRCRKCKALVVHKTSDCSWFSSTESIQAARSHHLDCPEGVPDPSTIFCDQIQLCVECLEDATNVFE